MLVGIVEKIDPMRTVLRTDSTVPVAVPNKAITEMIVSNESRIGRSEVLADFKASVRPVADVCRKVTASSPRGCGCVGLPEHAVHRTLKPKLSSLPCVAGPAAILHNFQGEELRL